MSGNYWQSTQRLKWQYTKSSLTKERQKLWLLECQLFPQGLNITMTTKNNNKDTTNANNNNTSINNTNNNNIKNSNNTNNNISGGSNSANNTNTSNNSNNSITQVKNIPITHKDLHYDKDWNLRIYCYFLIMKLGRRLNIRQHALATAHLYLSRFMLKVSVREVNLYLLITTCVYLACKIEECPQYIRNLVSEARSIWPEFIPPDPTKVTELEFYLIEELECYLIIFHPYYAMEQIVEILKNEPYQIKFQIDDIQNCWSLINDSYINDVHLVYPPHIIAMACMFITLVIKNGKNNSLQIIKSTQQSQSQHQQQTNILQDAQQTSSKLLNGNHRNTKQFNWDSPQSYEQEMFNKFMAESQVDLEQVMDTIQQQITLYEHWDQYHEPWIKYLLHSLYLKPNRETI